jgi:hypothetical protein
VLGAASHEGGVEEKQVRLMRERLSDFAVESIPGAGQYLFEERPAEVVGIITQVLGPSPPILGSNR